MFEILKRAFIILFSITLGFGIWYGIFWLVSNEQNAFTWGTLTKIFYIMMSIITSESIMKNMGDFKNDLI